MKDKKYKEMYQLYKSGLSLAEVGKRYGMTRQSVYIGFKRRNFVLRAKNKRKHKWFNGKKFTLRNNGYYGRTTGDRGMMHRYVWQHYNGEIPEQHDVHHIDGDKTNNDISNLECLPKSEHTRRYSTRCNQHLCRC